MPITPPTQGQPNWDVPLNAALNTLQSEIDTGDTNDRVYTDTQIVAEISRADGAYLNKTNDLSDLNNPAAARANLGLGNSSTLPVGTTAGTVAAGDDSRIVGALQKTANLSDLPNITAARTNLGLGNASTANIGTASGTVAAGDDTRITGAEQTTNKGAINGYAPLDSGSKLPTANLPNIPYANLPVGTIVNTVAAGNDSRITGALQTGATAGGDLAGTYPNPTLTNSNNVKAIVRSARLDEMAAPTFAVPMNGQKITGLANGTAATDAAAFGQLPTTLPPNGAAGGDLSGTYPNPGVAKVNGIAVTGTPTSGQVLTATSGTAANWQSPATTLPPSGTAGGDLIGTYPNPTLNATANVESVIRANRLDQFAAPTADVSMNNHKLTNVTPGVLGTDAATVSQLPTSFPPSGAAGGDLAGTYPNPTLANTVNVQTVVRSNRLDQMAAPTAPVSLNGQKITGLANGTISSDAAAFGQIPTTLPPNGSAGGDLAGTYPNPTLGNTANVKSVVRSNSLDQMTAPAADVSWNSHKITNLANGTVSSDAAAFGQIPTTLPPSGTAGGDLSGTYPGPDLANTANVQTIIRSNRLDQMAAPTADVSMNSHKITNLTNGTVATDAAAFGQIPTALPPSGTAGGDLAGTYPNPTLANTANVQSVVRTNRLDQMAAPAADVNMASHKLTNLTNGTAATDAAAFGQLPTTLPPSGLASGDLSGNYPAPVVSRVNGLAVAASPGGTVKYLRADGNWFNPSKVYDVKDYGAVGDGVTNDLTAVQAAFDAAHAAGGGTVLLPAGTYAVNNFIVIYENTVASAYGATIKSIGNTGLVRNFLGTDVFSGYTGRSNITILGGTWDGNASDGVVGTVTAETDVMNFVHASNIVVKDATITNVSSAHAIEFNAVNGGSATNCKFLGYRDNSGTSARQFSEAVQIDLSASGSSSIGAFDNTPSKNILVEGCYFAASSRLGVFGRAVGSHTIVASTYFDNIQVVNNIITGTLQEGINAYAWRNAVIGNNTISAAGRSGIAITTADPAGGFNLPTNGIVVDGNNIYDTNTSNAGIKVTGFSTALISDVLISNNVVKNTVIAIQAAYATAPSISGNSVDTTTSTGIFADHCDAPSIAGNSVRSTGSNSINISGSTGGSVIGNTTFGNATNYGIFVGQSADLTNSTNVNITGNLIRQPNLAGIRLSTSATGCLVAGNTIRKLAGAATNGISMASTATGCMLLHNDISGNAWSGTTAISASTALPITGTGAMTAIPGSNIVDTDITVGNALESGMKPAGRYETTSRLHVGTSSTPTSGTLYLVPIWLPAGFVISNLSFCSGTTGATTPTNYWFALFDSNRVALAITADQTTTAWASNTIKTLPIANTTAGAGTTYTTLNSGLFYVGFMIAAATPPTIIGEGSLTGVFGTSPGLGGTNTAQTTPPSITGGAFTAAAFGSTAILAYGFVS